MSLLISEPPLQVLPTLATKIGLNEAIFLQQLHYWLQRSTTESMGCRWVYNTAEQWQASFPFWSISTIERVIKSLRDMKLITSVKLHAKQYNHTNFYTICYQELEKIDGFDSVKLRESDSVKLRESSIQENTQETISSKNEKASLAEVVELYHEILGDHLPNVKSLSSDRRSALNARQRDYPKAKDIEWWRAFFEEVAQIPFLLGGGKQGWKANFDWLLRSERFNGIVEGKYK